MISQILRQTRRSQLLAEAEKDESSEESEKVAVYECKDCDMVSKTEKEICQHVQDCHRRSPSGPRGRGRPRSSVIWSLLATSFQKNVYVPEKLVCTEGDDQPTMYTVFACTLCHYQHLNYQQVRKHGTMSHFLEIPVFSCVYCVTSISDRELFDKHLEQKHRGVKVDFSFDCKALALLNEFLTESIYQIHVSKEGLEELIKDRAAHFTQYTDEKMLSLLPNEDTTEKQDSSASPTSKTQEKTGENIDKDAQTAQGLEGEGDAEMVQDPGRDSASTKKTYPRTTVRTILESMVQDKSGTKKYMYLKGAVKDLLKDLRNKSSDKDIGQDKTDKTTDLNQKGRGSSDLNSSEPVVISEDNAEEVSPVKDSTTKNKDVIQIKDDDDDDLIVVREETPDVQFMKLEKAKSPVLTKAGQPRRKRGRPRKYDRPPENDKEYQPQVMPILPKKKPKLTEEPEEGPADEGRYNFRRRKKTQSFSEVDKSDSDDAKEKEGEIEDEEGAGEDEKDKIRDVKTDALKVKITAKKIMPRPVTKIININPPTGTSDVPSPSSRMPTILKVPQSVLSAATGSSPLTQSVSSVRPANIQVLNATRPQSCIMVNGRLLPIITQTTASPTLSQSSVIQVGGPRPAGLQAPQIIQLPNPQLPQQPVRFTLPNQPNVVFNLVPSPQQQQVLPVQQIQQPIIIQQAGGPGGNPSIQVIPQNNPVVLPQVQGPISTIQNQLPIVIRPQTQSQTVPNVITLGGQPLTPTTIQSIMQQAQQQSQQQLEQQEPKQPVDSASSISSSSKSTVPQVEPIVIEPKEEQPSMVESSRNSDTDTDPEPENNLTSSPLATSTDATDLEDVKQYYVPFYICRRCMQIFLTAIDLDKHIYKEELERNPALTIPFSKLVQGYLQKFAITPMVPILQKGVDWHIPIYRCSKCSVIHILESQIKTHLKEHVMGVKCFKESLWSPSDLRVLCAKGWTTSVKMRCKQEMSWPQQYYKETRQRLLRTAGRSQTHRKVSVVELEMYDNEAKAKLVAKKSQVIEPIEPKTDAANTQPAVTPQPAEALPEPAPVLQQGGQLPVQSPIYLQQGQLGQQACVVPRMATQLIPGARILQLPGARFIQVSGAPQTVATTPASAPLSILSSVLSTAQQTSTLMPQVTNSQTTVCEPILTAFACRKCYFKDKKFEVVKKHVLQVHMMDYGPSHKCEICSMKSYAGLKGMKNHLTIAHSEKDHPDDYIKELYDQDAVASSLISCCYQPQRSAEFESRTPEQLPHDSGSEEQVEPDSSCDVGLEDEQQTGDNLSGISAPNILSCFSEEEEGGGSLDEKFLAYNEKRMMPAGSEDLTDTGTAEAMESENRTGEAFACRLCAYSCDTEQRVKQHMMSQHISSDMYPFVCTSCSYKAPSVLRLAQHVLYKHQKSGKKNPPKLAREMENDKEMWAKIMTDTNKYERFQQELDCLFRNCVEKC